jgi:NADH dehydrogenase
VLQPPLGLPGLTGVIAWAGWLAVHLYYLAGMGNRVAVLRDWLRAFVGTARPGFDGAPTVTVERVTADAGEDLPGLGVTGAPDGPRNVPVA